VITYIRGFIALVHSTGDAVTAVGSSAGLAVGNGVAGLCAVTELPVVAQAIVRYIVALVGSDVTGIIGTGDAVIAGRSGAGQTFPGPGIAGLCAVTEDAVVAVRVIRASGIAVGIVRVIDQVSVIVQADRGSCEVFSSCRIAGIGWDDGPSCGL